MKSARTGAMVFAFVSLVGGYFLHQYFWFISAGQTVSGESQDPTPLGLWIESVLPGTIVLGWVLLITAITLAYTKPDEEQP